MQNLPSDMGELLAVAKVAGRDTDGASATFQQFETCEPAILLLADAEGEFFFADPFASEHDGDIARELATALVEKLDGNKSCRLAFSNDEGQHWAFGVRIPGGIEGCVAGCLMKPRCSESIMLDHVEPAHIVCTAFGRVAVRQKAREVELRTRVAHLQAEYATLKQSQDRAIATGIEEREKRLQQQRQDMRRLEAVMNLAADGIITTNEDGVVESFNKAAAKIFGHSLQEVVGKNVAMLAPGAEQQQYRDQFIACWTNSEEGVTGPPREVMGKRKDGTLLPLEIAVSHVPLDTGCVLTGIFRDIAQRRRLECQLVQAQKMESVGQLAAGIAHEINTPTQYVGDNTRFLEDAFRDLIQLLASCKELSAATGAGIVSEQLVSNVVAAAEDADIEYLMDEIPKAINQSLEGVDRVAKIVRSMKEFSHPGTDSKQAVDLNRALEGTLTVCRNEWKYVADVVTDFEPDLPLVTCLPGECNQVFLNLIINAAHAISDCLASDSAEKGTITVATRSGNGCVEVRISDTGAGIPENVQSRVFDPFFTTKEVGRGTGQGLAIAHAAIAEKHGGTIHFETEIGRGTTFFVRLPIPDTPRSVKGA